MRRLPLLPALVACGLAPAGYVRSSPNNAAPEQLNAPAAELRAEEVVPNIFAATPLTETFDKLGKTFEAAHPGVDVVLSLAGSQDLVAQVAANDGTDVLAAVNESTMDKAKEQGLIAEPSVFAKNTLTLITPPGNPTSVTGLDPSLDSVKLVIYAPEIPCSKLTGKLTVALGIELHPIPKGQAVIGVCGKVASGEADAGIAYRTDVLAEGVRVETISIQGADQAVNTYPTAVAANMMHSEPAQIWVDLVLPADRQKILSDTGFTAAAIRRGG